MKRKTMIMDEAALRRAMARITHEIIERNQGAEEICLLGVERRGIHLANMLAENIRKFEGVVVPLGSLDITKHRDDMSDEDKRNGRYTAKIPDDAENFKVYFENRYGIWTQPMTKI